ncbi:MAG: transposase family protein, partial [Coprobacillus sp.]
MDYDTINLLGLQPNDIQDLNIVRTDNNVFINVTLTKKIKPCPCCDSLNANIKDYKIKKITHSIFNTNNTYINYRCRRFICNDCHKSFLEDNPFIA